MRWFKHMVDAGNDPKIAELEARFGFEGVGRWWRLVEIVAAQNKGTDVDFLTYRQGAWAAALRFRSAFGWRSYADQLASIGLCNADHTATESTIKVPKLLEIRNYRLRVRPDIEEEKEEDTDKEKEKNTKKRKARPKVSPEVFFSSLNGKETEWQKTYPLVDVATEIAKMKAWLAANPTRQKVNYDRFVVNWLSRAKPRSKTWQEKFDEEMKNDTG
jgi:hypothetical protein